MIRAAAAGQEPAREEFARRYLPVARSYLGARWRQSPLIDDLEDAVQEVFVACFKEEGVLGRADSQRPGGFRPFFYGVLRNVAREHERRRARAKEKQAASGLEPASNDEGLATFFDRAWAMAVLQQAAALHRERADDRRAELLRLRFEDGLPIREIAKRWEVEPAWLHKEYARARDEYKSALIEVVSFHHPGTPGEVERECARLLALFK